MLRELSYYENLKDKTKKKKMTTAQKKEWVVSFIEGNLFDALPKQDAIERDYIIKTMKKSF